MMPRRTSKPIWIGGVQVGGDAPIVVQSMTNTDTRDVQATIAQIRRLEECGCELVRVAVPDMAAARAIAEIRRGIGIPLIADIHFDYRLALASLEAGAEGLRLNPGNIRRRQQIEAVVRAAAERRVPIRIGVNAGSLPGGPRPRRSAPHLSLASGPSVASRMVEAALEQVHLLESLDFDLIKISLKAFDVPTTVEAYQEMARRVPYPLHLGITEAGTEWAGSLRSAVGIGVLLYQGIGDTIRVSLTGDPCAEVEAAYEILKALNLRQRGPTLISCPSCGRAEIDLVGLAHAVEERLRTLGKPLKVAVMGCVVNGPGEAMEADLGIAGGRGKGVIFRRGQVLRAVPEGELLEALMAEAEKI